MAARFINREILIRARRRRRGLNPAQIRARAAAGVRARAAAYEQSLPFPTNVGNGDETGVPFHIANFTKTLPHNGLGQVTPSAYDALLNAVAAGTLAAYENVPAGGPVKLVNPLSANTFDLVGPDSHHLGLPPSPQFSSAERAGEMAEDYWMALTRDIPFASYSVDPTIATAAANLSQFSDFRGPKSGGVVTPATIFRGPWNGDVGGPYISQFLAKDVPYGSQTLVQKIATTVAGDDHLTTYATWLNCQNGANPASPNVFDPVPKYIRNGRDLSIWLLKDFTYEGALNAALILLGFGPGSLAALGSEHAHMGHAAGAPASCAWFFNASMLAVSISLANFSYASCQGLLVFRISRNFASVSSGATGTSIAERGFCCVIGGLQSKLSSRPKSLSSKAA